MEYFLSTPFGLAFAFLLWMTFTVPKISAKWWAKLGKWICISYVLLFFWSAHLAMTEKGYVGRTKSEAHAVTVFTKEVSRLITEGKHKEAKELLDRFNEDYAMHAGSSDVGKFIEDLTQKAKQK